MRERGLTMLVRASRRDRLPGAHGRGVVLAVLAALAVLAVLMAGATHHRLPIERKAEA